MLADQDIERARAVTAKGHQEAMRRGGAPRTARFVLNQERQQQGLSDEEVMRRSGLDEAALSSMVGRDAKSTIETMEAYARALGKKLLIVLMDAVDSEAG